MRKRNYMGEQLGEVDGNGIAEWYPNCKVRFDGSHYIATPHTTNPARRRKRKEEIITVSEQDGKFKLEKPPVLELGDDDENEPATPEQVTLEEVAKDIPNGETVGELETVTDYNKKTGKQKTFKQNTFFAEKFGRNEFDDISFADQAYGKSIAYIMKYMEKQNEKAVYSRGLYGYFHSDIQGKDVICKMENVDETDNRLVLSPKFTCWDEGAKVGEVSPETIAQLPKSG